MNKLRTFVVGSVATLVVLAAWTAFRYGFAPESAAGYARALAAAALIPAVPFAAARGKFWVRTLAERRRNGEGLSFERKSIFVADDPVDDRTDVLAAVESAVSESDAFDDCYPDRFREGEGLTVRHTGFHNSFVRVTTDGRMVVTGASEKTHTLASLVERVAATAMERTRRHPFVDTTPVRGAPRAFMGLFLVVVFLFGVGGLGAAAYPDDVYSGPERAVLVGYDTRADAVPGYTRTDATLDKSAFLVDSLDEEAVEVGWDRDDVARLETHTDQAVELSATVSDSLASVRERDLSAAQRARVDTLEADLHAAECRVAAAVTTRIEKDRVEGDPAPLERDRATLRQRAAAAGVTC